MSRPLKQSFRCAPLADLCRQLLFSPPGKRIEQVRKTERLHDQIDPAINYPFDFIQYHITGIHSVDAEPTVLVGEAVAPDLRLIIDALSKSVDVPAGEDEVVESGEELASRLNVSAKTVTRWRDLGLRWRWARATEGRRRRVVYVRSAVEQFLAGHGEAVQRAAAYSTMTDEERKSTLRRAAELASMPGMTLHRAAVALAGEAGRTAPAIRRLLEQQNVFVDHTGPLSDRDARRIARLLRRGAKVAELARQFKRTRSTIYRAEREYRAMVLRRVRIAHVPSPLFDREDARQVILDSPSPRATLTPTVSVEDLPPALQGVYRRQVVPPEQLRSLSVRYNFLKHTAVRGLAALDAYHPTVTALGEIENAIRGASMLRRELVASSLHLVLAVARTHVLDQPDHSAGRLLRLIDLGHEVLLLHVEEYDAAARQTFVTSLTWRLKRVFADQRAQDAETSRAVRRVTAEAVLARIRPFTNPRV